MVSLQLERMKFELYLDCRFPTLNLCINTDQECLYVFLQEIHDYLKALCPDLHITRGEYDEDTRYPETKTLTIGQFKLGICHGHQVYLPHIFPTIDSLHVGPVFTISIHGHI